MKLPFLKRKLFMIIVGVLLFLVYSSMYFTESNTSNELIIPKLTGVDTVQIDFKKESSVQKADPIIIKVIYDYFTDLKMTKVTSYKESALIKSNNLLWTVTFQNHEKTTGMALIYASGEILMPDIKTIQDNRKTQMFIGSIRKEKLEELNSLLKKQSTMLKNECQNG